MDTLFVDTPFGPSSSDSVKAGRNAAHFFAGVFGAVDFYKSCVSKQGKMLPHFCDILGGDLIFTLFVTKQGEMLLFFFRGRSVRKPKQFSRRKL